MLKQRDPDFESHWKYYTRFFVCLCFSYVRSGLEIGRTLFEAVLPFSYKQDSEARKTERLGRVAL